MIHKVFLPILMLLPVLFSFLPPEVYIPIRIETRGRGFCPSGRMGPQYPLLIVKDN